jgi:formylmethanofuran dehydrogenase subunit C
MPMKTENRIQKTAGDLEDRRRRLSSILCLLAVFCLPFSVFAQGTATVKGRVTMSDGSTRASGVIVVATGLDTARALTNRNGDYSLQVRAPGSYAIRALRVGFRPTVGPTVSVAAGETAEANIQLTDFAVSLVAVTVRGDDVCRTSPDSGALVARAWEEARKAILSSQLSSNEAPLVAEWIEYTRTLDPTARIVRSQTVRTTRSPTTHAFRSVPPESLAARGYVTLDNGQTTFHAPDGAALLSDAFAATHCFHITPTVAGSESLLGIGFRPARDRADVRDIQGTFWLDRQSAELRHLEFAYTNLPPAADRAAPGGRVEFLRTGSGSWLIGRWLIRMPELTRTVISPDANNRRTVRAPAGGTLRAVQLTGGEVTRVARGDTTVYEAKGAALDVQLIARDRFATVAGGTVELDGTDYAALADNAGRARLSPVLEGRYVARIRTAMMDSLGIPSISREFEIARGARRDTVRLASMEELMSTSCGDSARAGTSLVRGSVRDQAGAPLANAAVVVGWQGNFKIGLQMNSDRVSATEETIGAFTDAAGRWRACGVPREIPLVVRVKTDEGADARRVRIEPDESMKIVDLVSRPVAASIDQVLPKTNRALVEISVVSDGGVALPSVTLDVEFPGGGNRTLSTGPTGLALIPDVAPGRLLVRARKIGFTAGQISATIAAGRNTVPIILSQIAAPALDTVRIVGDERRAGGRHDDFETRRLNKAGTFFVSRAEIEKRNPSDVWQMLQHAPGMKIRSGGPNENGTYAVTGRSAQTSLLSDTPCYMRVMVDGVVWPDEKPNLNLLPRPSEIHGMEVWAGPSSIPPQYGGTGSGKWCGMIAIWTR